MTRVTNFGRKRTYLQAGFDTGSGTELVAQSKDVGARAPNTEGTEVVAGERASATVVDEEPPKKKRKRIRKKKPKSTPGKGDDQDAIGESGGGDGDGDGDGDKERKDPDAPSKKALKKKRWREQEKEKKQRRLLSSEMRRQKRIEERFANTTCFACREKGHAAKDCPTVKSENGVEAKGRSKGVVGICYRCGTTRHTLSKCKKPVDESNPLPFASCFVCNGKGHLASSCPQNKEKGIYPNGGACKLCGEKTHLAKDCELRKRDNIDTIAVMGTGGQAGADEDDFHTFRRKRQEVEKEVVTQDKKRQLLQVNTGAYSGVIKSFGAAQKPVKKVVYF